MSTLADVRRGDRFRVMGGAHVWRVAIGDPVVMLHYATVYCENGIVGGPIDGDHVLLVEFDDNDPTLPVAVSSQLLLEQCRDCG